MFSDFIVIAAVCFVPISSYFTDGNSECPLVDHIHDLVQLPHETDCKKFYKCNNGKKILVECPAHLLYNTILRVCDWPQNVVCKRNLVIGECPAIDPIDYVVHLPHETDCTKFYTCRNGQKYLEVCPIGLTYNEKLQVCDWHQNAKCNSNKNSKPVETRKCPAVDPIGEIVQLPHETDCNKFYTCSNGLKYLQECPSKFLYNTEIRNCDWPQNVKCNGRNSHKDVIDAPKKGANYGGECPAVDPIGELVQLPHEIDCSKFYKCNNGQKILQHCPVGLLYNNELKVCDWPQNVNCVNVSGSRGDGECPAIDSVGIVLQLPHKTDCNKFYKCSNGQKILQSCPFGFFYNTELRLCDWPKNVECNGRNSHTDENPKESAKDENPKESANYDGECPAVDPIGDLVQLPHETDCSKFYKCSNSQKILQDCPDGLLYNTDLRVCDWPQNVNCGGKDGNSDGNGENNSGIDGDCPAIDSIGILVQLPHKTDCNKFYKCSNGQKILQSCPFGFFYNTELRLCDWPQNVECNGRNSHKDGNPKESANNDGECPAVDPVGDLVQLPHETDCSKFYKCSNGQKILQDCPDGLVYNTDLRVCDWPQNVNCGGKDNNENGENNSESDGECPAIDSIGILVQLPHKMDCNKFYKCSNGEKILQSCPSGLFYNTELQVCDWPKNVDCTGRNSHEDMNDGNSKEDANYNGECPAVDPIGDLIQLPHETDCSKFYKCDNGKKLLVACPAGLLYNTELKVCDWSQNVNCDGKDANSGINEDSENSRNNDAVSESECPAVDSIGVLIQLPHETDCSKFYKCSNGQKILEGCPSGLFYNSQLRVCDWPKNVKCNGRNTQEDVNVENSNDEECPAVDPTGDLVQLPHETDCSKFYKCDNGKKIIVDCPDGLLYNIELRVCDWPENVNCDRKNDNSAISEDTDNNGNDGNTGISDGECPTVDLIGILVQLPHENDCSKFYKCSNGKKILQNCPSGLFYNTELRVCDWPKNVKCNGEDSNEDTENSGENINNDEECPAVDPIGDVVQLPHIDCSKFYKCDNGKKIVFDCPDGLLYNFELRVCDWPQNVNCGGKNGNSEISEPSDNNENDKAQDSNGEDATENDNFQENKNNDLECPIIDPIGDLVQLPHETDCDKFYKCSNGLKNLQNCPSGLLYNQELRICDWPQNVECNEGDSNEIDSREAENESNYEECPAGDPIEQLISLPHETDCDKFYKCDNGKKVIHTCPDGFLYNADLKVCDWPQNVNCNGKSNNNGSNDNVDLVDLPHETDCGKFYKYINGQKILQECPTGLLFNTELLICDWPKNVECNRRNNDEAENSSEPENTNGECPVVDSMDDIVQLPHETDCSKFYKCIIGQKILQECPPGLLFNIELLICDWPKNVECNGRNTDVDSNSLEYENDNGECPVVDPIHGFVQLPHETDCNKFYKCINRQKYLEDCAPGLLYDSKLGVCDENVKCNGSNSGENDNNNDDDCSDDSSQYPHECDCRKFYKCSNGQKTLQTCPSGLFYNTELQDCSWSQNSCNFNEEKKIIKTPEIQECPEIVGDETIHFPHETLCDSYYTCDHDGIKHLRQCPDGLHFNPATNTCDWASNVNCEATPTLRCPQTSCQDSTIYLPFLGDVRKFIRCDNRKEILDICPNGLVFDKKLKVCNIEHLIE